MEADFNDMDPNVELTLLVDADETAGMLRPILRVGGPRLPVCATVHLNVVDAHSDLRLTSVRRFDHPEAGAALILGPLALPEGVCTDEATGWDWEVALCGLQGELARQIGPLAGTRSLNDEAELRVPELENLQQPASQPSRQALELLVLLLITGCHESVDLDVFPVDRTAAALLEERLQLRHGALPIARLDDWLVVAMAEPEDTHAVDDLRVATGVDVLPIAAPLQDVLRAIERIAGEVA